ncbi:hypothetical protein D9M73_171980 [compost metagenome]
MGRLSVKPSTCTGLANGLRMLATFSMIANALSLGIASPLPNSSDELSSISTHSSLPRTVIWSLLIRSPKASRTSSLMVFNGSTLVAARPASVCSLSLTSGWAGRTLSGCSSPIGIGFMLRSGSLNTPSKAWEITLYLPSLIEEMEYITTKKANSNVMKSAYDTSQRSWFSCSSV